MTQDLYERQLQQNQEVAANDARIRERNREILIRMWLSLGPDVIVATGSSHAAEIQEALHFAAHRWSRLLDMEQQVVREEQTLAARPKTRPEAFNEAELPDRTIKQRAADYQLETKDLRAGLEEMRKLAAAERKELESYTAKPRR